MIDMSWLDEILEECISKGREVEGAIKKIAEKARLEKLKLDKEFKKKASESEKMAEVKRKYAASRKVLYDKRTEHIKSIPDFWQKAILNCSDLLKYFSNDDKEITKFLKFVLVLDSKIEKSGRIIAFFFHKNPYFENRYLRAKYSRTDKGILCLKLRTTILWKEKDTTATLENDSFFTWFFDPQHIKVPLPQKYDEVLKMIEECLWPKALSYFLNWSRITLRNLEEGTELKIALDAVKIIQDDLESISCQEYRECAGVEREFAKKARELQVPIEQKCNKDQRPLYQKRNEIVKRFPNFWLLAFLSHPALGSLFSMEDEKIFKFVDSMVVEDDKDVVSGYTITLNFYDNKYIKNPSLTKRISFSENEDGHITNLSAVDIKWNVDMDIATEYKHDTDVTNTSFFTWFCAPQVSIRQYIDEVTVCGLIKDDLWPNAVEYFVNGNRSDEKVDERKRRREMIYKVEQRKRRRVMI